MSVGGGLVFAHSDWFKELSPMGCRPPLYLYSSSILAAIPIGPMHFYLFAPQNFSANGLFGNWMNMRKKTDNGIVTGDTVE